MNINYSEFVDMEFPLWRNIVYVLYFQEKDGQEKIFFYVGETTRGIGRFGDYLSSQYTASTDFKVGEAISYLQSLGFTVHILYKESSNRKYEENKLISELGERYLLLNKLQGYDYKNSDCKTERKKVHLFVERIVQQSSHKESQEQDKNVEYSTKERFFMNRETTIPELVHAICQELGKDGKPIYRKDIIVRSRELGLNESSIQPADYCDNTVTGKWSIYKFLHLLERGKYDLIDSNKD